MGRDIAVPSRRSARRPTTAPEVALGTRSTQSILGTQSSEKGPLASVPEVPGRTKWKDNREQLNLKLPQDLLEQLRRYAFDNRIPVTTAVVHGIQLLLGTQSTQSRLGTQGRNLPSSDLDDDDDDRTIANLYEKATGNVFNERDREFLGKYRELGVQCLTLAIATGRNRSRAKICKSFLDLFQTGFMIQVQ